MFIIEKVRDSFRRSHIKFFEGITLLFDMNECLFMIFYFVWCHCRCNMNEFFLVVGAIDDFTCYGDYVNFGTLMSVLRKKRTFFLHFIINMIFYTRVFLLWVLLHDKKSWRRFLSKYFLCWQSFVSCLLFLGSHFMTNYIHVLWLTLNSFSSLFAKFYFTLNDVKRTIW